MGDKVFEHTPLACRKCNIILHKITQPDGTVEYLHGKPWLDHDHDPEPAPATDATVRVCDFCSDPTPTWVHTGQPVTLIIPGARENKGASWAACDICDQLVRRRNVNGLVDRIIAHLPAGHDALKSPSNLAFYRQTWTDMHGKFLPTIRTRAPLPAPLAPPQPINPALIPKVRDRLVRDYFRSDLARAVFSGLATHDPMNYPGVDVGEERFAVRRRTFTLEQVNNLIGRLQRSLQIAELYWVSNRFTVLAVRAGMKLPDTTITREEMPRRSDGSAATSGLVVYQQPIGEVDGAGDRQIPVIAMSWCLVPGGVWIVLYVQSEAVMSKVPRDQVRQEVGFLMPASPGGGISFGANLTADGMQVADPRGMIRTLLATWFLMRQPGVADVVEGEVHNDIRKSYSRARRPKPSVRVVDLRKRPRKPVSDRVEPLERAKWSYRVMVGGETGGFWRTYWTGPGRAVREQRFIAPYLTGSDDMPLKPDVETVKALR